MPVGVEGHDGAYRSLLVVPPCEIVVEGFYGDAALAVLREAEEGGGTEQAGALLLPKLLLTGSSDLTDNILLLHRHEDRGRRAAGTVGGGRTWGKEPRRDERGLGG